MAAEKWRKSTYPTAGIPKDGAVGSDCYNKKIT